MKRKFSWTYGAKFYSVEADLSESPYYRKCQKDRFIEYLPYYSTIDDPVMKDIADRISEQIPEYADDAYVANVVLAMIGRNVKYAFDEDVYGLEDLWGLPVVVLENGRGDCDCMTDLYVSIAHNLDLDVVSVLVEGHMFAAAHVDWAGVYYLLGGKKYYHVEATSDLPVTGRYWDESRVQAWAAPDTPPQQFVSTLTECPSAGGSKGLLGKLLS